MSENKSVALYNPNQEQIDLIKQQFGLTKPAELQLFLHHAKKTGLDPLARQIYAIMRNQKIRDERGNWVWVKKMTIQMSIDGFRLIAERSGQYAGQIGPEWCGDDGLWTDVWLRKTLPVAARVAILRKDFQQPLWSIARLDAYAPFNDNGKLTGMWAKMAPEMLAKCAESLSLRRGFPMELAGYYTEDEMRQADDVQDAQPETAAPFVKPDPMAVPGNSPGPAAGAQAGAGGDQVAQTGTVQNPPQAVAPRKDPPQQQAPQQNREAVRQVAQGKPSSFNNADFPEAERLTLPEMQALERESREAASFGSYAFSQFWSRIGREPKGQTKRKYLNSGMRETLREAMDAADAAMQAGDVDPETGEVVSA